MADENDLLATKIEDYKRALISQADSAEKSDWNDTEDKQKFVARLRFNAADIDQKYMEKAKSLLALGCWRQGWMQENFPALTASLTVPADIENPNEVKKAMRQIVNAELKARKENSINAISDDDATSDDAKNGKGKPTAVYTLSLALRDQHHSSSNPETLIEHNTESALGYVKERLNTQEKIQPLTPAEEKVATCNVSGLTLPSLAYLVTSDSPPSLLAMNKPGVGKAIT